jgi:hypothetical protein
MDAAPWRPIRHSSQLTSAEREMQVDMELVVKILKELEALCSRSVLSTLILLFVACVILKAN